MSELKAKKPMIKVNKGPAPSRLIDAGTAATVSLKEDYDTAPQQFRDGTRKLKFKDSIFGHATVRNELGRIQSGKCCYCEVKIPVPYALQHVEHYRPKTQSRQSRKSKPRFPGYYWLAYDWTNLFLCCHFCNSSNKIDLFPLADDAMRARDHHDPIAQEAPLILCPNQSESESWTLRIRIWSTGRNRTPKEPEIIVDSMTLKRLLDEVRNGNSLAPGAYNRVHNRHNRNDSYRYSAFEDRQSMQSRLYLLLRLPDGQRSVEISTRENGREHRHRHCQSACEACRCPETGF